ncbi:MAG: hypothetical protein ACYC7I_11260 [Gammaproteobacteria bacterium]
MPEGVICDESSGKHSRNLRIFVCDLLALYRGWLAGLEGICLFRSGQLETLFGYASADLIVHVVVRGGYRGFTRSRYCLATRQIGA